MFKTSKILNNIMQILLITYLIYCFVFMLHHLFIPNIGNVDVESASNAKDPEIKEIKITSTKPSSKYYVLIYEQDEKSNWAMFVHQSYDKHRQALVDNFLPKSTMKYALIEGSKKTKSFTFQIKPKYPINYVARKKTSFHVIYIVPYKIYPFPAFYYCKHTVFYIDALK